MKKIWRWLKCLGWLILGLCCFGAIYIGIKYAKTPEEMEGMGIGIVVIFIAGIASITSCVWDVVDLCGRKAGKFVSGGKPHKIDDLICPNCGSDRWWKIGASEVECGHCRRRYIDYGPTFGLCDIDSTPKRDYL